MKIVEAKDRERLEQLLDLQLNQIQAIFGDAAKITLVVRVPILSEGLTPAAQELTVMGNDHPDAAINAIEQLRDRARARAERRS